MTFLVIAQTKELGNVTLLDVPGRKKKEMLTVSWVGLVSGLKAKYSTLKDETRSACRKIIKWRQISPRR